ncbi:hypothetical protein M758_2G202600 [Ceratodon purpureus]|nr:hypothetical protein M758_2G202600 [Ceratodon purpureus]
MSLLILSIVRTEDVTHGVSDCSSHSNNVVHHRSGYPAGTATEPRREIFTRSSTWPRKWIMVHMRIGFLFRTLVYRPSVCQKLNPDTQRQLPEPLRWFCVWRSGGHGLLVKAVSHAGILEIFGGMSLFQGSIRMRDGATEAVAGNRCSGCARAVLFRDDWHHSVVSTFHL